MEFLPDSGTLRRFPTGRKRIHRAKLEPERPRSNPLLAARGSADSPLPWPRFALLGPGQFLREPTLGASAGRDK